MKKILCEKTWAYGIFVQTKTSGNSKNIFCAAAVVKSIGMKVIGLTGENGGKLKTVADICICATENETYKIQELHLPRWKNIF